MPKTILQEKKRNEYKNMEFTLDKDKKTVSSDGVCRKS